MIVSHFELIFKPQSPAAPIGTAAVDRVVQGYFLEITNLENKPFQYALEFVVSPPSPGLPTRNLSGNTLIFIDVPPGTDNQQGVLTGAATAKTFRPSTGNITIPAHGTALVAVLPAIFPSPLDTTPLTTPTFEVRGYVNITLPALPGPVFFSRIAQSTTPVKVMLTPQNRSTYFFASGAISDQTQASLPLAEGAAVYALPPQPGRPGFVIGPILDLDVSVLKPLPEFSLPGGVLEGVGEPEMLARMLAGIDLDQSDLAAFNAALRQQAVPIALQRTETGSGSNPQRTARLKEGV